MKDQLPPSRPKPKPGKAQVCAIYLSCPYCGSTDVSNQDGSFVLYIGIDDVDKFQCDECGTVVAVPRWIYHGDAS